MSNVVLSPSPWMVSSFLRSAVFPLGRMVVALIIHSLTHVYSAVRVKLDPALPPSRTPCFRCLLRMHRVQAIMIKVMDVSRWPIVLLFFFLSLRFRYYTCTIDDCAYIYIYFPHKAEIKMRDSTCAWVGFGNWTFERLFSVDSLSAGGYRLL